jgi:ABC-2 type transport system ATP-binding protein
VLLASGDDRDRALTALGERAHPVGDARLHLAVNGDDALRRLAEVASRLDETDVSVRDVGLRRPTLDDVFLQLTGSGATAATADAEEVPA